jgi:hypothetical protein
VTDNDPNPTQAPPVGDNPHPQPPRLPQAPPVADGPLQRYRRPAAVTRAAGYSLTAAALLLLSAVLTTVTEIRAASALGLGDTAFRPVSPLVTVLGYVVMVALWTLLVIVMLRGANAARIMLTVLGAIGTSGWCSA